MKITGACHCRAISFSAEIDPARVVVCHCADCQVLSGAPLRAIVTVPIEQFALAPGSLEPKHYVKVAQSGNRRAQAFCPECGTPLYGCAAEDPPVVVIRLGCVDQRAELKPLRQIWRHSAMPWIGELGEVPGTQEQ